MDCRWRRIANSYMYISSFRFRFRIYASNDYIVIRGGKTQLQSGGGAFDRTIYTPIINFRRKVQLHFDASIRSHLFLSLGYNTSIISIFSRNREVKDIPPPLPPAPAFLFPPVFVPSSSSLSSSSSSLYTISFFGAAAAFFPRPPAPPPVGAFFESGSTRYLDLSVVGLNVAPPGVEVQGAQNHSPVGREERGGERQERW